MWPSMPLHAVDTREMASQWVRPGGCARAAAPCNERARVSGLSAVARRWWTSAVARLVSGVRVCPPRLGPLGPFPLSCARLRVARGPPNVGTVRTGKIDFVDILIASRALMAANRMLMASNRSLMAGHRSLFGR